MTAFERQLTRALRELSAQYERERSQHAAQIVTLPRQVEHFAGQVTRSTADYRTLAEMFARALELMRQHGRQRRPERDSGPSR